MARLILRVATLMALSMSGLIIPSLDAYSNGAPLGEACRTLYPGHGVDKQYGRSSYRVSAVRRSNDTAIIVTIYSPTDTFLGFLLQARLYSDREMLVNGAFQPDENSRSLDCLGGYQNTLTHTDNYPKYKIEAVWTPPKSFSSEIVFRATVVQSKSIFWTAIDSEVIEVQQIGSGLSTNSFNVGREASGGLTGGAQMPSNGGFVLDKDQSPYHVALPSAGALQPQQAYGAGQSALVQHYPPLNHESLADRKHLHYYLDYNVCARKLCFGLPNGCLRKRNCVMLLTAGFVPYTDGTAEFEIIADHRSAFAGGKQLASNSFGLSPMSSSTYGGGAAYYSMAFSHDKVMGNDSVTDCALTSDGRAQLLHSINMYGKSNEELADSEFTGVTVLNSTYTNGILYCKWRKRRRFTLRGTRFDLKDSRYYIMVAYGRFTGLGSNYRRKEHHHDRLVSESSIDLRQTGFISAHSKMFLIKIHGCFMVIAWMGFVSVGVITARYFKPLWLSHSLFGVRIWFAVHRSCMLFAMILITIASICIFLYVETFDFGTHQVLGLIALFVALINPIGAVFRPDCESENRWMFNWIHWLIGHTGHICAIGAIFMAFELTAVRLSNAFLWSIAFCLFFHLTSHALLTLYFCNCQRTKDTEDISGGGSIKSNNTSQHIDSLSDTSFLRYFFILYTTVMGLFVLTISAFIIFT